MNAAAAALLVVFPAAALAAPVTGRVHDAASGELLEGARLHLLDDATGDEVPAEQLAPGQQGQRTGADGAYRFDVPAGNAYRIDVDPPSGHGFPSAIARPEPGVAPPAGGAVVENPLPGTAPRRYFLRLAFAADAAPLSNNHLPLDPAGARVTLGKHVDRTRVAAGDAVTYTVRVDNPTPEALVGLLLVDRLEAPLVFLDTPGGRQAGADLEFGPFDLAPGASRSFVYSVVVGVAARPGRGYENRSSLLSAGGTTLATAAAAVHVVDSAFNEDGTILGRVTCTQGHRVGLGQRRALRAPWRSAQDGSPSAPRLTHLAGVRVYVDTGSWARVDREGGYHLTRIPAGLHLVKLDAATLPPGSRPAGEVARLITIGQGLNARADFAVICAPLIEVRPQAVLRRPRGTRPPPPASMTVSGDLGGGTMTVAVDGQPLAMPSADLALDAADLLLQRAKANLRPPDGTPVRFRAAASFPGEQPRAWTLRIAQVLPSARPLRSLGGAGAPGTIAWDGLDDAGQPAPRGAVYEAQLFAAGDRGSGASSPRLRFGITFGLAALRDAVRVWRGELFTGEPMRPGGTATLLAETRRLAAALGGADRVTVEVHDDGTGDSLEKLAATQKQAELVRTLLESQGVSADRVRVKGRGNLAPLARGDTPADRRRNRRVQVTIMTVPAHPGAPIPAPRSSARSALVDGEPVPLDSRGRFARNLALPAPGGGALVDLVLPDGRQAARRAPGELRPLPPTPTPTPTSSLAGNVRDGTLTVFGRPVDTRVLAVEARLRTASPLARRLTIAPVIPAGLEVRSWQLLVWAGDESGGGDGEPLHRLAGVGPPPDPIVWEGRGPTSRWVYRLAVDAEDGSRGTSPATLVNLAVPAGDIAGGRLFLTSGEPSATLRAALAAFATGAGRRSPADRYRIEIEADEPPGTNLADARLMRAARAGRVKALLGALGDRVEVTVAPAAGRQRLGAAAWRLAPAPPPRVVVDGTPVPVAGNGFDAPIAAVPGEASAIELFTTSGARGELVVTPPPGTPPPIPKLPDLRKLEELPAIEADEFGARELEQALVAGTAASDLPVAGVRVWLPPRDHELTAPELLVAGIVPDGVTLQLNGAPVELGADGTFEELFTVPPGESTLTFEAVDVAGNHSVLRWPLRFRRHSFLLALAEGIGGSVRAPGAVDDSTVESGGAVFSGRIAIYGRLWTALGGPFRDAEVTVHLDTAKQTATADLSSQLHDPTVDYPVLGDTAVETRDAEGRSKVQLSARVDESRATVGTFHSAVGSPGALLAYDRTLSGGDLDLKRSFGQFRQEARVFGARADGRVARAVDLFRATGGALYYLRHARLLPGGERVRVVVRDRDSGLVIDDRALVRDVDYSIDDGRGRLLLRQPLAGSVAAREALSNLAAALEPAGGHPVFLEVGYEYQPDGDEGASAVGVVLRERLGENFSIAGGYVGESDGYRLLGAEAEWRPAPRTGLRLEVAGSRGSDAPYRASADGGLTFSSVGATGEGDELAWKAELDSTLGDLTREPWAQRARVRLYAQELDDGFRSSGTLLEQGRRKIGGAISVGVGARGEVALKHDTDVTAGGTSYLTSLRYAAAGSRLGWSVEAGHQRLAEGARRVGAAAQVAVRVARRLVLRAAQEAQVATGDDPLLDADTYAGLATTVGADVELARDVIASSSGTLRWNGDLSAAIGLRSPVDDHASIYAQQRLGSRGGRVITTGVIGGEERIAGGRAFAEAQLEHGVSGPRNRAVLGVGRRFVLAPGLRLDAGYQHQASSSAVLPDGRAAGDQQRDVVHGAVEWLRPEELKATASIEVRFDQSTTEIPLSDLDVGGPLPQVPLVLPPGERSQIVAGAAVDWTWTRDQTFLLRFRLASTRDTGLEAELARHVEATAGWAVRPLAVEWLDLLFRYTYLDDRRPGLPGEPLPREISHVLALAPLFNLSSGVSVSTKLAWKHSARSLAAGEPASVDALLVATRIGVRIAGRWEVAGEVRVLSLDRPSVSDSRAGALLELAYDVNGTVRLGLGYDFSRFSADELEDLERDDHGFYVRLVGRY